CSSDLNASDEVRSAQADPQGVRTRRPSRGRTKKLAPAAARTMSGTGAPAEGRRLRGRKAIPGQSFLAIGHYVADECPGQPHILRVLQDRDRVVGRDIEAGWNVDTLHHSTRRPDVGDVDDPG